jgi:catechol 2,3-dioxygenase-like lactoylglutathione lyase family enzyme
VQATGITANLPVPDIGEARDFYVDYLGLSVEGFNMGWVARYQSPDGRAVVQLVTRGFEIVHPLTTEPWGIRRFFVRAPDGNVININNHKDD